MRPDEIHAQSYSLEVIFTKYPKLQIPFFQRSYVWKEEEWKFFWETMEEASDTANVLDCFMGAMVFKHDFVKGRARYVKGRTGYVETVIDGQQRLITTILFFKAMCDNLNNKDFFDEHFYKSDVSEDGRKSEKKIILEVSRLDEEVFEKIIKNNEINEKDLSTNLYQCYEFFKGKDSSRILINRLIKKICFVVIGLQDNQDEQKIFDTLNSVGVNLTTAELLKNYLFKRTTEDKDDHKKYWEPTFEKDKNVQDFWDRDVTSGKDKRKNADIFFQSFFHLCNENTSEYTKTSSLYRKYKDLIDNEKIKGDRTKRKHFLESVKEYGDLYFENIDNEILKKDINKNSPIQKINLIIFSLNIITIIPYVLYILKASKEREKLKPGQGEKMRDAMLLSLESYIMRRVILNHTTKNYNKMFASLHRKNGSTPDELDHWLGIKNNNGEPTNEFPSNLQIKKAFDNSHLNNQKAKAVLYLIEKYLWEETCDSTQLRAIGDYSIEHIMPKAWNQKKWPLSNDFDEQERKIKINLLGNLTIIPQPLNSQLQNESWEVKKEGKKSKNKSIKGLKECCAGLKSFNRDDYLRSSKKWDESQIVHRTKFLAELAIKIWKEIESPKNEK